MDKKYKCEKEWNKKYKFVFNSWNLWTAAL